MPCHPHRIPGWTDLKTFAPVALGLACLLSIPALAGPQESTETPPDETPEESIFLAPFVSASFLRAVADILDEIRLIQELTTGVYVDEKALLQWAARDNGRDIDWRRAERYCEELELAGFDDWRLPTLAELEDLMEPMSNAMYSVPPEISLSACCLWSSTSRDDVAAWNFNFRYSKRFSGSKTHTFDLRALCVRDWTEEDRWLPEETLPTAIEEQQGAHSVLQ
jgi:hypothetical protein